MIAPEACIEARKAFYVSPFCRVEGRYRFSFDEIDGRSVARIDYHDEAGLLLATALSGRAQAVTTASLLRALLAYPLMTFGVVARIHWQALRLWLRRVPLITKPPAPLEETTR